MVAAVNYHSSGSLLYRRVSCLELLSLPSSLFPFLRSVFVRSPRSGRLFVPQRNCRDRRSKRCGDTLRRSMAMKRQKNSFGAATDLQANVSARRFKRRSRAAVVSGFRGRASAHKLGMSTTPFYNSNSNSNSNYDYNYNLQLSPTFDFNFKLRLLH